MSTPLLEPSHQPPTSPTLKQLHSLSTLAYNKTPTPSLLNTTANINLSRFKSIDITDKAKKNIAAQMRNNSNNSRIKNKRNQSLGSITQRDMGNPEITDLMRLGFTNKKEQEVDYVELNKEMVKDIKAKQFLNKVFGTGKIGNHQNHSHNLSTDSMATTHKMDMTLPVIQHKRHSSKRANFLQQWLDEALDPQDLSPSDMKQLALENSQSFQEQLKLQPASTHLATVKKYQVDKQYLRSQNIPTQIIDRLYNTLFIYTHGINNVFTELLSFVKPLPNEETKDSRIVATFWKCFVKLLEGCTSFQTSFQKVQEQYAGRISQLRQTLLMKQAQFIKQKEYLNNLITRYEKQKIQSQNNYTKLQSEYKIAVSTLQLTDNAFNQQVQLRLKFQEKINHIYSSYEELKNKYQTMITTMEIKNQQSFEKATQQVKLKERIRQLEGQLLQIQDLLTKEKNKVKQRQLQVNIKKQELLDLEMSLQITKQKEKQEEDVMEIQVSRNGILKTRCQQVENRLKMQEYTLDAMKEKLKEQTQTISDYRKMNEQLHLKYNEASQKLIQYQATKIYQSAQITKLTSQLTVLKQKLQLSQSQSQSLQSQLTLTQQQLLQTQFEVQNKSSALQQINSTIQDLKAIKDKYERLWKIMEKEKIQIQNQRNKIMEKYELEKEEFVGLKMLYESREKHIKDIEAKHDKEKELLKRKITGYNQIVTKKQSLILTYQKNQEEKGDLLLKRSYRIEQLEKQLTDQKSFLIRKQKQNTAVKEQLNYMQKEAKKLQGIIKQRGSQLQAKLKEFDLTHEELQSVKSLMSIVKEQQNSSITNLTTLYEDYRQLVNRKGQHIHPMLYEDLVQHYNRLKLQTIPKFEKIVKELNSDKDNLRKQIEQRDSVISHKNEDISKLNQQILGHKQTIDQKTLEITKLHQSNLTLDKTVKQQSTLLTKHQQSITKKQQTITQLTVSLQTAHETISSLTHSLNAKQLQIDKLSSTVTQLSEKLQKHDLEMQQKQKQNPYLIKVEKLEKELVQVRKELIECNKQLRALKSIAKNQQQIQTEPQGQVAIYEPKSLRKNKFFTNDNTKSENKQVQVCLSPYDSIPQYIDTKITQISKQQLKKQEKNESPLAFAMKGKSKDSNQHGLLNSDKSLTKIQPKEPITRREELRRALRFTYMRR